MSRAPGLLAASLLVASVLVPACADRPSNGIVVRDSSGVRIVEHPSSPDERALPLLEVPTSPPGFASRREGGAARETGSAPEFSRISAMDQGPDGLLYVLDGIEAVVTVVDPETGTAVRRFGRKGRGPGEFRSAADLQVSRDGGVLVGERIPLRIHRFSREGEYLSTARLDLSAAPRDDAVRAGQAAALAEWRGLSDGDVIARILTLDRDPTRPGTNQLVRVGPDGTLRAVILQWEEPGSLSDPPPLLAPRRSWTTGPGGSIHYTAGDRFEVRTLDRDGRVRRILRRSVRRRPVGREERELALRAFRESMVEGGAPVAMVDAVAGDLEVAPHLPGVHGLWFDHERGELWVGLPGVDRSGGDLTTVEYHLFGGRGRFLGRVEPPPGFTLHSVRSRRMVGSVVDDLGVPHPRVYQVSTPTTAEAEGGEPAAREREPS